MKFITFEGGEGAGKTTLINRIGEELKSHGHEILITREPGGTPLGEHVRSWLLNTPENVSVGHVAELLLFLAARAQHLEEKIRPAMKQGKIVLCDRFNDSTLAYQGFGRGLGYDFVKQWCQIACQGTEPNLTFYLDIDTSIGLERTLEKDRISKAENAFHNKIREGFQMIAKREPKRFFLIDASQSKDDVFENTKKILNEHLF